MHAPSHHLTTRTGFEFHVRPARPEDSVTVTEFFTHVTRADLRFRFLTGLTEVGPAQIVALTHVDHRWSEDFLAFTADGSTMIATAMLACDETFDHGEVAIALSKDYKGRGVGWELLAYVARFAEAKGVRVLEAIEARENHAAIELEREMGFTVEPYPGDPTLLLVSRKLAADGLPPGAHTRPM